MTANGPLRILHVIPGLTRERGGPTTCVQALARHQAEAGHRVTVLTTDQGARHGERLVETPVDVLLVCAAVRGPDRLAYAPGFGALARRCIGGSDVVHVHSLFTYPVHAALREASAAGVPVVIKPCGLLLPYSLRRSAWIKWAYRAVWGRMVRRACTAWHYTSASEAAGSWPWEPRSHFVLPNGVEPDDFAMSPDDARRKVVQLWPQVGDSPYVLFLGRIHAKKRIDLLLQAFQAADLRGVKLVVAGPDEDALWRTLERRHPGVTGRVVRIGTVGGVEKVALLAAAALFALPSEHENFGIAALEALAAGTPVLLSPHVDLAADAHDVELVHTAPLSVAAWAERLADLLTEPRVADEHSAYARQWVRKGYAWNCIADRAVEHYRDLISGSAWKQADEAASVVRSV